MEQTIVKLRHKNRHEIYDDLWCFMDAEMKHHFENKSNSELQDVIKK